MKPDEGQRLEVLQVYETWLHAYINGDTNTYDAYLDDEYRFIGSTNNEEFLSREATTAFFKKTSHQLEGRTDLRHNSKTVEEIGGLIFITHFFDAYFLNEGNWNYYGRFRFSSTMQKKLDSWKFIYQHFSMPDTKSEEGDTIGYDRVAQENQELKEAIRRRTIELESKNRELAIESALERIRTRTLSMKDSDELAETATVLFKELEKFGFLPHKARPYFTVIDHEKQAGIVWITKEDGSVRAGSHHVPFTTTKSLRDLYEAIEQHRPIHIRDLAGEMLDDYLQFLSGLPHVQHDKGLAELIAFPPERMVFTDAIHAYGTVGIMAFEPISQEAREILIRFANVFEFTYTRFLDLQNAEVQAREAQVEAALERTRTQSMIMQHSNELDDSLRVFHEQVLLLGINSAFSYLWLPDEINDRHIFWAAWGEELPTGQDDKPGTTVFKSKSINYPLDRNEPATAQCLLDWKSNEPIFTYQVLPAGVANYFATWQELIVGVEKLQPEYFTNGLFYVEAFMNYGCFGVMVATDLNEDERKILARFAMEFERTYTRFLDLQKAETQAREAQIEAALERVRSRSMAMHKSDDLHEVIKVVTEQLSGLGLKFNVANFAKIDRDGSWNMWLSTPDQTYPALIHVPYLDHPIFNDVTEQITKKNDFYTHTYTLEESNIFFHHFFENTIAKNTPEERKQFVYSSKGFTRSLFSTKNIWFSVSRYDTTPFTDDENAIFKRFAKAFEQTYTRFLDLQKAEAQAREAQIEAALERVRSRTMGMQKSEELKEVIQVVYEQFVHLNILIEHTGFIIDYKANDDMHIWLADRQEIPTRVTIPYFDCAHWNSFNEAKEKGNKFFSNLLDFEEKNRFYQHLFKLVPGVPDEAKEYYFNAPGVAISTVLLENVGLYIENFSGIVYTDEENVTLMRFGKVFQQTYTRFLDLQKAETQAKEAQAEAALEKVRSRTMAMQHSDELGEVATILFKQMNRLVDNLWSCGFVLCERNREEDEWWLSTESGFIPAFYLPNTGDRVHENLYNGWKNGETYRAEQVEGIELEQHYEWLMSMPVSKKIFEDMAAAGFQKPVWQKLHGAYFSKGYLVIITQVPCPEEEIFKRFAQVFDLTYTRFLDLQKAEAQGREAQIQLGLERVRARAMAMQNSDELNSLIGTVFVELTKLDLQLTRCVIMIMNPQTKSSRWWMANSEAPETPMNFFIKFHEHAPYEAYLNQWRDRTLKWEFVLEGTMKKEWDDFIFSETELNLLPDFVIAGMRSPERVYLNASFNNFGNLTLATLEPLSSEHADILLRFAKVFDLTYTRFNDLKQAEAQTIEAKIEASLERVRSKAMAMHSSRDLANTIGVFYHELELFSTTPRRCGVGLLNKETRVAELSTMNTTEEGKSIEIIGTIKMLGHPVLEAVYDNWLLNKEYHPVLRGDEIKEYYQLLRPQIAFPEYPHDAVQYGYFFFFPEGGVYAWTDKKMAEDELTIYRRFTSVLSLTYKRYKDLLQAEALAVKAAQDLVLLKEEKKRTEDALAELKLTQKQLIQSEKMASLGELTAGIAHEIQNPLNFVNNFSEVSNELLNEMMEEVAKGNYDEARAIADDVRQNLEKINEHGKRADGIVKGMLQHSRSSTGQAEATDINVLAGEYLRLAYHGLRAKDNSFNASLKTNFDETIGKINIIPQDIGRVILNLITNAFYAVAEKKKGSPQPLKGGKEYEPAVTITTKLNKPPLGGLGASVLISIGDNGNGIPRNIIDKIFQPFFTTKPTGQGTGLGLSLAYDIIKAHGGVLAVETKEGEGCTFMVTLPIV